MTKILRNAVLILSLTSCLAIGATEDSADTTPGGDRRGLAVALQPQSSTTTNAASTAGDTVAPLTTALTTTSVRVSHVGSVWKIFGYKDEFVDPLSGEKKEATVDGFSAALGAAYGVTQATRVELGKREEDLRKATVQSSAQIKEIAELKAALAAANASKDEQVRAAEQRFGDLAARLEKTERMLNDERIVHSLALRELASAKSAAETNQRLVDMMREEAGEKEQLLGSLRERLLQFQRQLRVVVTSEHPVEDLDSARKFVVGEYQKEKEALERELATQRDTLSHARAEHEHLTRQRGETAPSNLEELIAQAATRIQRLQADVHTKERLLDTLTTEKIEIEKEIKALEAKSVHDFIEDVRAGKLRSLYEPFRQFSELARRGHNHKWAHGEGLSKGSQWLGEELVSKLGKDRALQLLTDGGLLIEMAEWFISSDAQQAIIDHGRGTSVGTREMDKANWVRLKSRFGVV